MYKFNLSFSLNITIRNKFIFYSYDFKELSITCELSSFYKYLSVIIALKHTTSTQKNILYQNMKLYDDKKGEIMI